MENEGTRMRRRGATLPQIASGIGIAVLCIGAVCYASRNYLGESMKSAICLSNLRQIGVATSQYMQDNDQTFPPDYTPSAVWMQILSGYTKDKFTYNDWGTTKEDDMIWHCPSDPPKDITSYALNAMLSGAFTGPGNDLGQPSKRLSDVRSPEEVVWAGDTNKKAVGKAAIGAGGPSDWMRSTDTALHYQDLTTQVAWYRDFLAQDYTDFAANPCPDPLPFGCKGPSYRHFRTGVGKGDANMVFVDGHAASIKFGSLTVANIFPDLSQVGKLPPPQPRKPMPQITTGTAPKAEQYTVRAVLSFGGAGNFMSQGGGINSFGEVVGGGMLHGYSEAEATHAFILRPGSKMQDLGSLPGFQYSAASAVNDHQQVVGRAYVDDYPSSIFKYMMWECRAFLWDSGKMRNLGTVPGYLSSIATGINNGGQVIGDVYNPGDQKVPLEEWQIRAFVWQGGKMTLLPRPAHCTTTRALAINDRGQIVGWALTAQKRTHAVLWENGTVRDLGLLPGGMATIATAINNMGQIAGDGDVGPGRTHLFLWQNGKMRDLGQFANYTACRATVLTDSGVIYGKGRFEYVNESFVWTPAKGFLPLSSYMPPGCPQVEFAYAVNRAGVIFARCGGHATVIATPPPKGVLVAAAAQASAHDNGVVQPDQRRQE